MHNNMTIQQDGFREVYPVNMTKPRTIVLKGKKVPGRKRMSDKTATKEPVNETAAQAQPVATTAAPVATPPAAAAPPPAAAAPKIDIEQFSRNIARMIEEGGKALA